MIFLRSTLYHIVFFTYSLAASLLSMPCIFLPRPCLLWVIKTYLKGNSWLEKIILGLTYEVRGLHHLPQKGPFIVAAKHQSAYETLKIHLLLDDPAVVLKRELLSIPLWGALLKKSDVIAIDRSSREEAMQSLADGARRMAAQSRPILIFPQGTRVNADDSPRQKPYKGGISRIQEVTLLPIVPLALNSGYFFPRRAWRIRPGTVVFEFLPPIYPGLRKETLMAKLEKEIEDKSNALLEEAKNPKLKAPAQEKAKGKKEPAHAKLWFSLLALAMAVLSGAGYTYYWRQVAEGFKREYAAFLTYDPQVRREAGTLTITGFPGRLKAVSTGEFIQAPQGSVRIEGLSAEGWPFFGMPIRIETGPVTVRNIRYANPFTVDSIAADIRLDGSLIHIDHADIAIGNFSAKAKGEADLSARPYPGLTLEAGLRNHESLLASLLENRFIEERGALFVNAGLNALKTGDVVSVPLTFKNGTLYAGPLMLAAFPPPSISSSP